MTRRMLSFSIAAAVAGATPLLVAAPALAQSAISPGMTVVDPSGGAVGTVTSVSGQELIVKTDRHEVRLPVASFTPHEGKLLFAMTQAQLNAETDKALAAAEAAVVAGAEVRGMNGALAGTIEEITPALVTVKLTSGELVRLPRTAVAGSQNGAVLGVSVDELKAQLASQAEAPQAEASAGTDAGATAGTEAEAPADAPGAN